MGTLEMPKKYKYCFFYNGVETELLTDPKGWDEKSLNFQRNDNLSVITTFSIPLSFGRDGRKFLRNIFDAKGTLKSDVKLRIYKRNNDWSYSLFYLARVNTAEYSDDFKTITMSLEDIGLQTLIDRHIDQIYDINYNLYERLYYSGINKKSKNILQLNVKTGLKKLYEGSKMGYYEIPASRSTREYNNALIFVNDDDTPYTRMMFKCAKDVTVSIELNVNFRILKHSKSFDKNERLFIIKHSGYDDRETILEIQPRSMVESPDFGWNGIFLSKTEFFYNTPFLFDVSLIEGEYLELVYRGVKLPSQRSYSIDYTVSKETSMIITSDSESPIKDYGINMMKPKYLMENLLYKITNTTKEDYFFTLDWRVDFVNFEVLLSSSEGMRNLENCKIKASLKDLLKWLRCWNYTYQIEGQIIRILSIDDLFKNEINNEISKFNDLKLESDNKHVYTSLDVGYNSITQDKQNGIFEFNCTNTFENKINVDENKLDLISPYIGSMYDIEEYLIKIKDNPTTSNLSDNKIFVFACVLNIRGLFANLYKLDRRIDSTFAQVGLYDKNTAFNIPLSPMRMLLRNKRYISISLWKTLTNWVFTSSEVTADIETKMRYENNSVRENSNITIGDPLFLPLKIMFNTASLFKNMNTFSIENISKYFSLSHKNGIFIGYIDDVNMNIGDNRKESYSLLVKEIKEYK